MVESALAQKQISGMMSLCFSNERPLKGMLGYLDWRFGGPFTQLLKTQILTGEVGEKLYVPLRWNEDTYHFLLIGAGELPLSGVRPSFSEKLLDSALQTVDRLKIENMGLSAEDWNLKDQMDPELKERKIWILN